MIHKNTNIWVLEKKGQYSCLGKMEGRHLLHGTIYQSHKYLLCDLLPLFQLHLDWAVFVPLKYWAEQIKGLVN